MNTLLINPDPDSLDEIRSVLESRNHQTAGCADVTAALAWLEDNSPELVVVERGSLEGEGQAFLDSLQRHDLLPIIVLTSVGSARSSSSEQLSDLDRLSMVLRRLELLAAEENQVIHLGELIVDVPKKRATFGGKRIPLTPIQFRLLTYLARKAGQVVDYRELLRNVWGFEGDDREARELLKVHIRQIRRKMGLDVRDGMYLVSSRGFGYMLIDPEEDHAGE
jgi:DNA-binding response OmpR family regulator